MTADVVVVNGARNLVPNISAITARRRGRSVIFVLHGSSAPFTTTPDRLRRSAQRFRHAVPAAASRTGRLHSADRVLKRPHGFGLSSLSSLTAIVCFLVGLALGVVLISVVGAPGAATAASSAYLTGDLAALLPYRKHVPFRLRALVLPQSGDFEVLRAFAPPPLVRPRPQRS